MVFFISYDISDNRLRTRLAKLLLRLGCHRVQKSVYIAIGFSPKERGDLTAEVRRLLQGKATATDSVLYIPVEKNHLDDLLIEGDSAAWRAVFEKIVLFYS